jgi:hypothetical protein
MMQAAILTPVFNDWESLGALIKRLNKIDLPADVALQVVAVNDGSAAPAPADLLCLTDRSRIKSVTMLELACNL